MEKINEIISEYDVEMGRGYLSDYSHHIKKMMIGYAEWYAIQTIESLNGGRASIDPVLKTLKFTNNDGTLSLQIDLIEHE